MRFAPCPPLLVACLLAASGCLSSLPGHGAPDAAIGFDISIVVDARHIEITADVDLPTGFAVDLRNRLDADHDYQIQSPDEQQRLLWLIQAGDGPLTLTVDGTALDLAPLYNPQLHVLTRASASLRGRGRLRASWFGRTPASLRAGSRVEFRLPLWNSFPATCRISFAGQDGMSVQEDSPTEKTFAAKTERTFVFHGKTGFPANSPAPAIASQAPALNTPRMIPANAVQLAEALALNHGYLLPDDPARNGTAELHRQLRMAIQRTRIRRRADGPTLDALNAATAKLVQILESARTSIRVDLREPSTHPDSPPAVQLPGDAGALLLRVQNGPGPHRGRIYDRSFDLGEFRDPLNAGTFESGTTWILARLSEIPADPTLLKLALHDGDETLLLPVRIHTPKPARLRLTVLSDDTGMPTPAMVSLHWKTCHLDRRPANALDLLPQFGGQGRQTSLRTPRLTGLRGRGFWVVPGPFEMEIPPGEWEIVVRRGTEHTVVSETFELQPGESTGKTFRPKRWINMPGRGWYAGDDHVHSRILSDTDATNLLAYAAAEDIYLANIVKMGDLNRTFFQQRGHGPEYRVSDGLRVLSPGQECPRTHEQLGHTLAMNTRSFIRDTSKYYLYDTVFDEVHRQGGLSGYAHLNRDLFFVHRDMSMNIPRGKVDFGEILQFGVLGTELYYEFLNLGFRLTASAGSDLPWGGTLGEVRVYASLGDQEFSADHWFAAFARGRTFVSSGPMLDLRVDDAIPGDTMEVTSGHSVKVRARLDVDPALGAASLELVAHGKVIRRVTGQGIGDGRLTLEHELPIRDSLWLALQGSAADGSVAHTTPVYIIREGRRFWQRDEVPSLITKRLSQLDEIVVIVAEARQAVKDGASPALTEIHELANQGDALLERVQIARDIYSQLEQRHRTETHPP